MFPRQIYQIVCGVFTRVFYLSLNDKCPQTHCIIVMAHINPTFCRNCEVVVREINKDIGDSEVVEPVISSTGDY